METTRIACRAKDPGTCRYHGADIRAEEAFTRGDIEAYFTALAEKADAAKTDVDVQEFFAKLNISYTPAEVDAARARIAEANEADEEAAESDMEILDWQLRQYSIAFLEGTSN